VENDRGALIGHQADERQVSLQLKMQAPGEGHERGRRRRLPRRLRGQGPLWPFGILLALPVLTLFAGWVIYHDHGGDQDAGSHPGRDPMLTG
jgi:hypothetical protein